MKNDWMQANVVRKHDKSTSNFWPKIKNQYELYLFLLPTVIYFIIFKYIPMYGIQIAFKNFIASKGMWASPWVGFKYFERFFDSFNFWLIMKNTLGLSIFQLIVGFPIPILVALMLNQLVSHRFKRIIQSVIYAPHFISTVVLVGMLYVFLSPSSGIVNHFIQWLGGEPIFFMSKPELYKSIYVFSGVWQETGWATIIYLAALSGISPELHEAAIVDGANKWRRIQHIDIPGIMPAIMIILILSIGNIMNVGFEKAFLMQTALNLESSEIIPTYVYKVGLQRSEYSYSAAVGLFNAIINLILLLTVNWIAKKSTNNSLW